MEDFNKIKHILGKSLGVIFKVVESKFEDDLLDEEKKLFVKLINHLEKLTAHEHKVFEKFNIDISTITEPYWAMIEECLNFSFDADVQELIWWYVHDRKNAAGEIVVWEDESGIEYRFNTPGDLYEYILFKFEL